MMRRYTANRRKKGFVICDEWRDKTKASDKRNSPRNNSETVIPDVNDHHINAKFASVESLVNNSTGCRSEFLIFL